MLQRRTSAEALTGGWPRHFSAIGVTTSGGFVGKCVGLAKEQQNAEQMPPVAAPPAVCWSWAVATILSAKPGSQSLMPATSRTSGPRSTSGQQLSEFHVAPTTEQVNQRQSLLVSLSWRLYGLL